MNCSCINDLEVKLAEKMTAEIGSPATVSCESAGFTFGKSVEVTHFTKFKVKADAKGYSRGKSMTVVSSFCPYCGKSAKHNEQPQ